MDGSELRDWFTGANDPAHRKYEALRAVIVDDEPAVDVADRTGIPYGTLRNWLSELRQVHARGEPPPFFKPANAGDQLEEPQGKTTRRPRMFQSYR